MKNLCAAFIIFVLCSSSAVADVRVLVATLPEESYWARAASVAINMQIFRTLRKQGSEGQVFPDAEVIVNPPSNPVVDYSSAERAARLFENAASIVVWGSVYELPGEVAISSIISVLPNRYLRPENELFERWGIETGAGELAVGLPRPNYNLKLILVSNEFIQAYSNPNSLPIYERASSTSRLIGYVEQYPIKAIEVNENWIKVRRQSPDPVEGWIATPNLGPGDDELVNFVGGLVRTYRGDWSGAEELFSQVAQRKGGTVAVKSDATLLWLRMRAQRGADTSELSDIISKDLPTSLTALRYVSMAKMSACVSGSLSAQQCARANQAIASDLQTKFELFPPGDAWLSTTKRQMALPQ